MLTLSELNQVIKHFAYQVQQRIDDLDRLQCILPTENESTQPQLLCIISKYHNYVTKDQKQSKLAHKLVEHILQIFDFLRIKSKNQNLLTIIYQKIQAQLNSIIEKNIINIGQLLSYIRMVAKPGGIIRIPAEKKRILVKSIGKEPSRNEPKISPTLSLYSIQRRGTSLINPKKHIKTMTLGTQKWKMDEVLNGIWSCLELQRIHFVRVQEVGQQQAFKQMLRRNEKTLRNIRQYEKRWRFGVTQTTEYQLDKTTLSEIKSNIRNNWISKRKKIGLCKKRNQIFKENMSIII